MHLEKLNGATVHNTAFVFDFDATMLHKYVDDIEVPSIISILRSDGYLGEDYSQEAYAIKEKYHPIEVSLTESKEAKLSAVISWWSTHEEVLIKYKLSLGAIEEAVKNKKLVLRKGFETLLHFSHENSIPLFIFSASGIGKDSITKYLEYKGFDTSTIHVISNSFTFDKNGIAVKRNDPLIHSMNKNEEILDHFPKERDLLYSKDFVILAGDSIEDPNMASEKYHKAIYRIGFCCIKDENKKKEMFPVYRERFDIVLSGDSEMSEEVDKIISKLSSESGGVF